MGNNPKMIHWYWAERNFAPGYSWLRQVSLQLIHDVMEYGGSEIATIALRRANADSPENILDFCRNI